MSSSSRNDPRQKIVFLDRDGVINRDSPAYIKKPSEFVFLPGSLSALVRLSREGFSLFVVTNQSVINRQMVTLDTLGRIHAKMTTAVEKAGGVIRDIFFCPHRPEEGCRCRKPGIGLIEAAEKKYRFRAGTAAMVGDSARDVECAARAGCRCKILVGTGNIETARRQLAGRGVAPDRITADLAEAADWLIDHF